MSAWQGMTAEHSPVARGVRSDDQAPRPHEDDADHQSVADDEDPDDFIDSIV